MRVGITALALCAALMTLLAGCGADATPSATTPRDSTAGTASTSAAAPAASTTAQGDGREVRVRVGSVTLTGRPFDNGPGNDLAARLPLTLNFSDLNRQEKIAHLAPGLTVEGMPRGDDPRPGDIGYYEPEENLVLYYGDVGYWDGIMRIGRIDGDVAAVARQQGDFTARLLPAP